jgi:hypothetical protein
MFLSNVDRRAADVCDRLQQWINRAFDAEVKGDPAPLDNAPTVVLTVTAYTAGIAVDDITVWDSENGYPTLTVRDGDDDEPRFEYCLQEFQRHCARLGRFAVAATCPAAMVVNANPTPEQIADLKKSADEYFDGLQRHLKLEGVPSAVFPGARVNFKLFLTETLGHSEEEASDILRAIDTPAPPHERGQQRAMVVLDEAGGAPSEVMKNAETWAERSVMMEPPPAHRDFTVPAAALGQSRIAAKEMDKAVEAKVEAEVARLSREMVIELIGKPVYCGGMLVGSVHSVNNTPGKPPSVRLGLGSVLTWMGRDLIIAAINTVPFPSGPGYIAGRTPIGSVTVHHWMKQTSDVARSLRRTVRPVEEDAAAIERKLNQFLVRDWFWLSGPDLMRKPVRENTPDGDILGYVCGWTEVCHMGGRTEYDVRTAMPDGRRGEVWRVTGLITDGPGGPLLEVLVKPASAPPTPPTYPGTASRGAKAIVGPAIDRLIKDGVLPKAPFTVDEGKPDAPPPPATLPKKDWIGNWPSAVDPRAAKGVAEMEATAVKVEATSDGDEVDAEQSARAALEQLKLDRPGKEGEDHYRKCSAYLEHGAITDALKEELRGAMYDWRTKRGIV